MKFSVLPIRGRPPAGSRSQAFLEKNGWDDFNFKTLFALMYVDAEGAIIGIGNVKIASLSLEHSGGRLELPDSFETLDEPFFSLGQDDSYYEALNGLGPEIRDEVLLALRDVAADLTIFEGVRDHPVTGVSLLRSVPVTSVHGQFHRLAHGGARLSSYSFSYTLPPSVPGLKGVSFSFDVHPDSRPPTNIHVLIGRNAVGKTRMLDLMSRALVTESPQSETVGHFDNAADGPENSFASLVSVTFSAFDDFEPLAERRNKADGLPYSYVGLKQIDDPNGDRPPKSFPVLAEEFVSSVRLCRNGARADRWRRALEMLEADPIFKDANVASLADESSVATRETQAVDFETAARSLFKRLSSGHKIVLLTITRLVETVEERSLVLLDEPETHLHPPLLSAFVRSLSDLLTDRNGVAIIATHSPVILQEVPRSCVWKVRRSGTITDADRPDIETFGENVGVLTREVFGLEVTDSGFHRMLREAVEAEGDFASVLRRFDWQVGGEAQALIQAMITSRRSE